MGHSAWEAIHCRSKGTSDILFAMKIAYLNGPRLRRGLLAAGEHLRSRRAELNRINVFPVPDGDTGSNMVMTVRAVTDELARSRDRSISQVSQSAATAAVLGARGNSGLLLSQFFLGFADRLSDRERASAKEVAEAILAGAERVERALEAPTEGTIVTVIRDSARAITLSGETDIAILLAEIVEEARASLARTPDLLPILREAGVVDAGAKGYLLLLEGMLGYLEGTNRSEFSEPEENADLAPVLADFEREEERYRFCTEALVEGSALPDEDAARALLHDFGDSLQVVRSGSALKVHIHTDGPKRVFDALRSLGDLVTHRAEDMRAQSAAVRTGGARTQKLVRRPVGILTDSACDLSDRILNAHGIRYVPLGIVAGEQTFRDRVELSAEEFHERLAQEDARFDTSQPSPGEWLAGLREAAEEAEELVVVTLAAALSGTHQSAKAAGQLFHDVPVHVVDTRGITLLEGLLVLKAAELAEAGVPAAEIVTEIERIRDRSGVYLTLDSFDRLVASGRIGPGVAWVGNHLDLKPILRLDRSGTVVRAGQTLGRHRVLPALLKLLERELPPRGARVRFGIAHVGRPEILEDISQALRDRWGKVEILTAAATPVIANHVGLGAWAVAYMVED